MPEKKFIIRRNPDGAFYDLPVLFRTNDEKYELLARLAYNRPSQQQAIDTELFRPGWQQRLGVLRKKQRAEGIPDADFLHSKRKKEQGLDVKPGRRINHRKR